MYHISSDVRTKKSADLIADGLLVCLKEKDIDKISITDISNTCYVSRATFYRLFDSIDDVLAYMCDRAFEEIRIGLKEQHFTANKDIFIKFIGGWLKNKDLMKVLAKNNIVNVIYETHIKNIELVKEVLHLDFDVDEKQMDYLIYTLSGIIPLIINVWYLHGANDSAEQIYENIEETLRILQKNI